MSLFGGSAPPSRSSYESDSSRSSSPRSSPAVEEIAQPEDAQNAQGLDAPIPLDADDDIDTESEADWDEPEEEEEEEEEEPTRPNRFVGQPRTWQSYTDADRQIAESLNQIQDTDLAAHLYNAHALKRRLRRPAEDIAGLKNWHNRDNWLTSGNDLQYTDASGLVQTELVPAKEWTAWPLPPARLAGLDGTLRHGLGDSRADEWMIGGANTGGAGEELREELLAVFLRLAKERWNSREADPEDADAEDHATTSRSRSRSKSAKSIETNRSASRTDVEMLEEDTEEAKNEEQHTAKKCGRKPQVETYAASVVLADDARAQRLLAPSIQSMMSKLDDLVLAVRRTRMNHFGRGGPGDSSQSEFTSGVESSRPGSRASSRAPSKSASRPPSRAKSVQASRPAKQRKKAAKGRTKLSDGETASATPSDSESSEDTSRQRKRRRSQSATSDSSASTTHNSAGREGLMDWSEVLGIAAVKGWDEGAIARTAQRCASLFDESMSFIPFHESLASIPVPDPVLYIPTTIPAPNFLPISQPPSLKRPFFQSGTLRCPHSDCFGHQKDFEKPHRVVEHCIRVHQYDPRTNDLDNEERTVGGVHVDGFLQPVTVKLGWLGNGRVKAGKASKKKRQGKREREDPGAPEAVASVED
jgi:hypothetical protein